MKVLLAVAVVALIHGSYGKYVFFFSLSLMHSYTISSKLLILLLLCNGLLL